MSCDLLVAGVYEFRGISNKRDGAKLLCKTKQRRDVGGQREWEEDSSALEAENSNRTIFF